MEEYEAQKQDEQQFNCGKCSNIGNVISAKFESSSRDDVLDGFLAACGKLSSFSDACSSLVISNFNEIYAELAKNLKAENICHMTGVCSAKFHQHKRPEEPQRVEIRTNSNVGFIKPKDDIPCELCEQLIKHLRDILVANTTESEFKQVLEGLCKQTKTFSTECISLVDQYYPIIYESLVNNLDANGACFMIGVCPKGINSPLAIPHMPLLPIEQKVPRRRLGENEKSYSNDEIQRMILPIDQLMGAKSNLELVDNGQFCTVCQYFLHFVQEEISNPKTEDQIKEVVGRTCDKFPSSVRSSCHEFVNLYGDAVVALLVQEIDPREVCPMLKFCPKMSDDVDVFAPKPIEINAGNKPQCPLCVLVIEEAQKYIESQKSEEQAKRALKKVCSRLPPKLQLQCNDFVETYYEELLKKLLSDFTPMEICKDIALCATAGEEAVRVGIEKVDFIPHVDLDTNEIPDFTYNGRHVAEYSTDSGECMLCVEVVGGAENKIKNGMTKEQVENVLLKECSRFRAYEGICDNFVKKNVDEIIDLVSKSLSPKQVCQKLSLCAVNNELDQDLDIDEAIIVNIVAIPAFPKQENNFARVPLTNAGPPKAIKDDPTCVLCEFIMTKLEQELKDKTTQDEIKQAVENICAIMPNSISKQCTKFIDEYAELIISLIDTVPPKQICQQMSLCAAVQKKMTLVGDSECTWGPSHFCSDVTIADKCKVCIRMTHSNLHMFNFNLILQATEYCKKRKLGTFA